MLRKIKIILTAGAALLIFILWSCGHSGDEGHRHEHQAEGAEHASHDPSGRDAHEGHETPAGHEHPAEAEPENHHDHAGHEDHLEAIELSDASIRLAGIGISRVAKGKLKKDLELPGEVGFNEDRLVHVVPRFPGIARAVYKNIGDRVKKGDLLAEIESNESLSRYGVRAALNGRIVEKHISLGEFVSEDERIFLIADLSNVWITFSVYAKDARYVQTGQTVRIEGVGTAQSAPAVLSYVSPNFDNRTRSLTARAVLSNRSGQWRPGTFVKGLVSHETSDSVPMVQAAAVQTLENRTVVFVPLGTNRFRPEPVQLGMRSDSWAQVLVGPAPGDNYVSHGAFELKAKIVTSGLSGHGHSH
jgi:cobalt-zinc-cadmium efflux system membrane fusion protein